MNNINAIIRPSSLPRQIGILSKIPIIGWLIGYQVGLIHSDRVNHDIMLELKTRSAPTPSDWADDRWRFEIASKISRICKEMLDWPNSHFYPSDSFSAMIEWETGDLCEQEALEEIEDQFDCYKLSKLLEEDPDIRLEEVVDYIVLLKNSQKSRRVN